MRVEVLDGIERRRRWSREAKMGMIEETLAPGAVVAEIARRHGIAASLLFTWRRQARIDPDASKVTRLVPVRIVPVEPAVAKASCVEPSVAPVRKRRGLIEIRLGDGRSIRVEENVDVEALGRILAVLSKR